MPEIINIRFPSLNILLTKFQVSPREPMLVSIVHGMPTGDVMKGEKTIGSEILNEWNWLSLRFLASNPRIDPNQDLFTFVNPCQPIPYKGEIHNSGFPY